MIRDAIEADLPAIVGIYNAAIPTRTSTCDLEPVSVEERREWFAEHGPDHHPIWVYEQDGGVVGWLSLSTYYGRAAYARTVEVGTYVSPDYQRRGIAAALLEHAVLAAPGLGLRTLLAFILGGNDASIALFRRYGFQEWGRLPEAAELDDSQQDVLILGRHVP